MRILRLPRKPPPQPSDMIEARKLVIGEGPDDAHFLRAFAKHLGLTDLQAGYYGGKNHLFRTLNALLRTTQTADDKIELQALAVTIDADRNADEAFQFANKVLVCLGYPALGVVGKIVQTAAPANRRNSPDRIGIFVLPDNSSPGMLETLCLETRKADPAMQCVHDYFACVAERAGHRPDDSQKDKARAHAYLASWPYPALKTGTAAPKNYWDLDSEALRPLAKFLGGLQAPPEH